MKHYNPNEIEKKWQHIWEEKGIFHAAAQSDNPKFYPLVEFPYPSGKGLHVGHPRPYTALDIVARKRRLQDYNVLFPMGWDAFGLPTENFAIQNKMHPRDVTIQNIERFKKQLQSLGFSFDWSKEIDTTDPEYYKWTQWIFIQMFKKGLAYKKEFPINWCPSCKVGLANEEVVNGGCERCGNEVVKKIKNQWMLRITAYADRLIDDLDDVDYIECVKTQQKNWIGRSYGCEVDFKIEGTDKTLKVFTTRADTLFGATYMVIAPEHGIIETLKDKINNMEALKAYREASAKKSDIERTELDKEKTGVEIKGIQAINPVTGKTIPIFISDYVLSGYGTGAIMAVPAHDTRDYAFAKAFDLPIIEVVSGGDITKEAYTDNEKGLMINSDFLDGLSVPEAIERMSEFLEGKGTGEKTKNYKLRDWVFSRQRYWGEPIPLVYCEKCGWVPVPEESLPVELPEVESYEPTDNGESPLAMMEDWVNTTCPTCGGAARRETDTMPQWAGSSWYFIRYIDPKNKEAMASEEKIEYWMPADWYNGGMEHTTLHLLYSRFWYKFLYAIGVVNTKEPYQKRTSHGMILGENNEKMSKSRGNVINPDDIVSELGADTLRMYEMFIGDFEKSVPWSQNGVKGCRRFLDRVWKMASQLTEGNSYSKEVEVKVNKTIKKVSEDFETLKFNTAISALMELANEFLHRGSINKKEMETFLILLNPVAPHITEELWVELGYPDMLNQQTWPTFDESKTVEDEVQLPIQINAKLRGTISINRNSTVEEAKEIAFKEEGVLRHIEGKTIVKEIYIPGKIFNLVVK